MRSIGIVTFALLLVACADRSSGPPGPQPVELKGGIVFGLSEADLEAGTILPQLNLSHTRDLWVRIRVPGMPRVATAKLVFVKPTGEAFYEQEALFSPDPSMKTMETGMFDHPLQVYPAKTITGGFALDSSVPIGGSVFERFPTQGTWTVQATVDGIQTMYMAPLEVVVRR